MIVLEVIAFNGQPQREPLAARFDPSGGTIGRGADSTLRLPDPEKSISRTHASIVYRAGQYVIIDRGSATRVVVNGRPLGSGQDAVIDDGDEIGVGGYRLRVRAIPSDTRAVPAAPTPPTDDPLALLGGSGGSPSGANPFGDLLAAPTPANREQRPADRGRDSSPSDRGGIPAGFDPFAEPTPSAPGSARGHDRLPDDLDLGLGQVRSGGQNVDKLFGLGPAAPGEPFGLGHPLGESGARADSGIKDADLRALLEPAGPQSARAPQRDQTPELNAALSLPKIERAADPNAGNRDPRTQNMVVSWEHSGPGRAGEIRTVILDTPPLGTKLPDSKPAPAADSVAPAQAAERAPRPNDELLQAFLAGAGVPTLEMPGGLTPQLMHVFGQLLRESTQGTLDLLAARALSRRELRAQVTVVVPRDNNPLKFSPNVETALAHLLAPQGRGFMTPLRAMRDAHTDLKAHQLAVMAGMRAALAGVLARFDPARLARRLTEKSVIDAVLPMNRKAKLWDLFEQLFEDLSHEAEDDFHALFGKEFMRAYQEALDRIDRSGDDHPQRG